MSNLGRQEMHFRHFFTLGELVERIEKVTAEAVQKVAQDFFDRKGIALTILGNLDGFKLTREDLVC
jgi:predicted Zn-dependent peptidase